jgi:Predicted phosphohydrolases
MARAFRFVFLSDLHFGSVPDGLANALLEDISAQAADLNIVAGDLTMRARAREFEAARSWIGSLKGETLVLPGNHDLPYFNLVERFARPFGRYRSAMTGVAALEGPVGTQRGAVICAVNTARAWQPHPLWQEGAVNTRDLAASLAAFAARAGDNGIAVRAAVTHHPLIRPATMRRRMHRAIGARRAVEALLAAGVEIFMSGHVHRSFAEMFEMGGRRALALGAPTALSSRLRGERNGYWVATIGASSIALSLRQVGDAGFEEVTALIFPRPLVPIG